MVTGDKGLRIAVALETGTAGIASCMRSCVVCVLVL